MGGIRVVTQPGRPSTRKTAEDDDPILQIGLAIARQLAREEYARLSGHRAPEEDTHPDAVAGVK